MASKCLGLDQKINSVDFSAVLRIIVCKVQFGEGDFSGEWGAGQLPVTVRLKNFQNIMDFG